VPQTLLALVALLASVAAIVWGAETFAEHLTDASARLGVSTFALALLLAGAEPEELATSVTAALRGVPAIAYGDVIGTNVAMCTVALGLGALIAPLPFGPRVRRYALLALPVGVVAVALVWDGHLGRAEGALLVGLYATYVALIWRVERHPPALGELSELDEDEDHDDDGPQAPVGATGAAVSTRARSRVGRDLLLVLAGLAAMAGGATVLVEAVRRLSGIEETQTKLGLTVVGFATAFELVVLAVSAARRGMPETVLASVVGSFAYNVTMTLGAGALARPLTVLAADQLHLPLLAMLGALLFVLALALPTGRLTRPAGALLLAAYPGFIALVLAS
jgi:cation:H+ antiporter